MSMMYPLFKVQLFKRPVTEGEWKRSQRALLHMMESLVRINCDWLRYEPSLPMLYRSGVVYQREDDTEEWLDIPHILEAGWGDCEDLACWRAAEIRVREPGMWASPHVTFRRIDGEFHYHALLTKYRGGPGDVRSRPVIEDPSRKLGM